MMREYSLMDSGIIFKSLSGFYYVVNGTETAQCRARGRFRHENLSPLVGDKVSVIMTSNSEGIIDEILPRRNAFSRPPVANVDNMVIIVSEAPPVTDTFLIDCMTAAAENSDVDPIICINKCDIASGDSLYEIYSASGFRTFQVSAATGLGIDRFMENLQGTISVFTGNSGVGKSSLINRLCPGTGLKTGGISDKLGRGRHTTRHVELLEISADTFIADTPGFSVFDTDSAKLVDQEQLQYVFREFTPYIHSCRFTGCSHTQEIGCAVLDAVSSGKIPASRHKSYVRIYRQLQQRKPWENK